ncbi:MAG: serine/threonine protein kinase, partial [Planctomycetaceae bacterium]|nr:serine/threonine protein kinase [Planctomycetaceae bacterium]
GIAYRARNTTRGRDVVLKIGRHPLKKRPLDPRHEVRLLAKVSEHPHLVRVDSYEIFQGYPCLITDYVEGDTLQRFYAEICPEPTRAAEIVAKIALAVAEVNKTGTVHCDIKPDNILLGTPPHREPVLIDLGMGRIRSSWSESTAGDLEFPIGGTRGYMAPEQVQNLPQALGEWTDVFGLGGVLYFLATGQPPCPHQMEDFDPNAIDLARLQKVDQVGLQESDYPAPLVDITLKCLALNPSQRYASAIELSQDLESWLASTQPQPKRHLRKKIMGGSVVGCALLLASFFHFFESQKATDKGEFLPEPMPQQIPQAFSDWQKTPYVPSPIGTNPSSYTQYLQNQQKRIRLLSSSPFHSVRLDGSSLQLEINDASFDGKRVKTIQVGSSPDDLSRVVDPSHTEHYWAHSGFSLGRQPLFDQNPLPQFQAHASLPNVPSLVISHVPPHWEKAFLQIAFEDGTTSEIVEVQNSDPMISFPAKQKLDKDEEPTGEVHFYLSTTSNRPAMLVIPPKNYSEILQQKEDGQVQSFDNRATHQRVEVWKNTEDYRIKTVSIPEEIHLLFRDKTGQEVGPFHYTVNKAKLRELYSKAYVNTIQRDRRGLLLCYRLRGFGRLGEFKPNANNYTTSLRHAFVEGKPYESAYDPQLDDMIFQSGKFEAGEDTVLLIGGWNHKNYQGLWACVCGIRLGPTAENLTTQIPLQVLLEDMFLPSSHPKGIAFTKKVPWKSEKAFAAFQLINGEETQPFEIPLDDVEYRKPMSP